MAIGLALAGVAAAGAAFALWPRGGAPGQRRARAPSAGVRRAAGDTLAVTVRAMPRDVTIGGEVVVAAEVLRGRGRPGQLTLSWRSTAGRFGDDSATTTTWRAPAQPGDYTVGVLARDDAGEERGSVRISVVLPRATGDLPEALRAALALAGPPPPPDFGEREQQLRAVGARRDTLDDRQRAQIAMEQLGQLLLDAGRYEEALAVWRELTATMLPTDPLWRRYRERLGTAAFFLGLESEAIAAFQDAGNYASGMSGYYLGDMLARRGQVDEAIGAYALASRGERRFADPVLRLAQLELERGHREAAIAALIEHAPLLGRTRILERLDSEPALAPLAIALEQSGRTGELVEAQTIPVVAETPQVVGDGPVSVREATGP